MRDLMHTLEAVHDTDKAKAAEDSKRKALRRHGASQQALLPVQIREALERAVLEGSQSPGQITWPALPSLGSHGVHVAKSNILNLRDRTVEGRTHTTSSRPPRIPP